MVGSGNMRNVTIVMEVAYRIVRIVTVKEVILVIPVLPIRDIVVNVTEKVWMEMEIHVPDVVVTVLVLNVVDIVLSMNVNIANKGKFPAANATVKERFL